MTARRPAPAAALRRLPPVPAEESAREAPGEHLDLERSLRVVAAPLAGRLRARRAWADARGADAMAARHDRDGDAVLRDAWVGLSRRARAGRATAGDRAARLAVLRAIAERQIGLRPHLVQLVAAAALSDRTGVEMATGEGKTLVTMMAAALQAAEGWPVHVITANDYLAARDREAATPLFTALGLSAAVIVPDAGPADRRGSYACDIVYASSKEIAFDHLRDRIALGAPGRLSLKAQDLLGTNGGQAIMRGLWSAIVDEADSVLIDEARTPLIISAPGGDSTVGEVARSAMALTAQLRPGVDFRLDPTAERPAELTESGLERVLHAAAPMGGVWRGARRTRELAERALYARHHLRRDAHYILREDKVEIVDENTGRIMADRTWSDGLHQMVEIKEGLPPSPDRETLGRLTFQRFFRRYRRLSGLSGTLAEARGELTRIYDLTIVTVPTHRPSQRRMGPTRILPSLEAKWTAVAAATESHRAARRPVLIGTRTVSGAEAASAALAARGVPHAVLSARQDAAEADVLANAGRAGAVTVATNMAGRGADIRLDPEARAAGGLTVLLCDRHEARRIDRQLIGRCARQGDPGLVETFLSAEDDILGPAPPAAPGLSAFARAQHRLEKLHARQRADLNRMEDGLNDMTAFAGGLE